MKDYRVIGESEAIFIPLVVMVYPIGTLVRSTSVTISQAGLKVSKSLEARWDGPLDESWNYELQNQRDYLAKLITRHLYFLNSQPY